MKLHEFFETHGWTQGAGARDATGERVPYDSPFAVSWCLVDAAARVYHTWETELFYRRALSRLQEALIDESPGQPDRRYSLVLWNDARSRTREEVIALCRKADV